MSTAQEKPRCLQVPWGVFLEETERHSGTPGLQVADIYSAPLLNLTLDGKPMPQQQLLTWLLELGKPPLNLEDEIGCERQKAALTSAERLVRAEFKTDGPTRLSFARDPALDSPMVLALEAVMTGEGGMRYLVECTRNTQVFARLCEFTAHLLRCWTDEMPRELFYRLLRIAAICSPDDVQRLSRTTNSITQIGRYLELATKCVEWYCHTPEENHGRLRRDRDFRAKALLESQRWSPALPGIDLVIMFIDALDLS